MGFVDSSTVIAFPRPGAFDPADAEVDGAGAGALAEIDAAITLVAVGAARRVRLTALPFVETVLAVGLAHARAAGMAFRLEGQERDGVRTVTIGPLDRRLPG